MITTGSRSHKSHVFQCSISVAQSYMTWSKDFMTERHMDQHNFHLECFATVSWTLSGLCAADPPVPYPVPRTAAWARAVWACAMRDWSIVSGKTCSRRDRIFLM
jgi:hypothetical protein